MKIYDIANIKVTISFNYDSYLKDNLKKYETNGLSNSDYHITSLFKDSISLPKGNILSNKNPFVIQSNDDFFVIIKDTEGLIKAQMQHDKHYKHVSISLNPSLIKDPAEMEYVLMSLAFMEIALRQGYLSLHAAAIIFKDEVILISAPSQTGKSTHAKYWLTAFEETLILNDDKPLIKMSDCSLQVYGSPFSGKNLKNINTNLPLKSIVFLKQGLINLIKPMTNHEILENILRNMHRPLDEDIWQQTIPLIESLIEFPSVYQFEATNHIDSAIYLNNYLYKEVSHET